jgi:DNA-binding beta-propeller fold protein YncE
MKKNLLVCILSIYCFAAFSQAEKKSDFIAVSVFPNPTTEFITVTNEEAVKNIQIFNFTGRKMKNFDVVKGERYDVADLPNGLYFVQLIGRNNKVLATQRLTKKA